LALGPRALQILSQVRGRDHLSLGYPDLLPPKDEVQKITGVGSTDSKEVFKTLKCVDFYKLDGVDETVDLCEPVDLGKYDLVIDPGTIEHCFNVAQAFKNAAQAVKVGGCIFHIGSLSMVNHAFYSFSPTLFYDFYQENGFEIEVFEGIHKNGMMLESVDKYARKQYPSECVIHCLARRIENKKIKWPIQWKYRKKWG
jgi:hypothetical protein